MFAFLKGTIEDKHNGLIVINVGGVGFEVFASLATIQKCADVGEPETLLTHLVVKEDEFLLVGFKETLEKALFKQLLQVSGVGVKSALQILSAMHYNDVISAIKTENVNILVKSKACGKKTAERIVLELKDKFDSVCVDVACMQTTTPTNSIIDEASQALTSLGLTKKEAIDYASKFYDSSVKSASELVSRVLKGM